jgi:hypothetical protein
VDSEEIGRTGPADPRPDAKVQLTAEQARDAANAAEKAILLCRGLEVAYSRVAAMIPLAGQVTEDDGKFLAMGRVLFPNTGWIEIGHAQWARRVHEDALALKIVTDVLSRAAALNPEEIRRAKDLQDELTAGRG